MKYRNIFISDATACELTHNNCNLIAELLVDNGYAIVNDFTSADIILFFGCLYVTTRIEESVKELEQILTEKNSNTIVIITGCFARKSKIVNHYKDKVDYIIPEYGVNGIAETMKIINELNEEACDINISNMIASCNTRYCNINITDGCNNRCSFCKNNYMNTHIKSRPIETIIEYVKTQIAEYDVKCVTLTGLNTTQYGVDLVGKKILHELLRRLSSIEGLLWIRVKMLAPQDMYQELVDEIIRNKKVVALLIPIQTCSNKLLKDMNRKHTDEQCFDIISQIRNARPDIFIVSELMSCFPTETPEDIIVTSEKIRKYKFNGIFISPYRNNSELPSGKMKQLSDEEDWEHLWLYQKLIMREFSRKQTALKGQNISCIIEGKYKDTYVGITYITLCTEDICVLVDVPEGKKLEIGSIIKAKVTALPPKNKKIWFNHREGNVIKAKFVEED